MDLNSNNRRPLLPKPGLWVPRWQSPKRWDSYLEATGGDEEKALRAVSWNHQTAALIEHDISHIEVGVRNIYHEILAQRYGPDWPLQPEAIFPDEWQQPDSHRYMFGEMRKWLKEDVAFADKKVDGQPASIDQIITSIRFVFWTSLSHSYLARRLWDPTLHKAWLPGVNRKQLHPQFSQLREIRNRAVHHDSLLKLNLRDTLRLILDVAEKLDPHIAQFIAATTALPHQWHISHDPVPSRGARSLFLQPALTEVFQRAYHLDECAGGCDSTTSSRQLSPRHLLQPNPTVLAVERRVWLQKVPVGRVSTDPQCP